MFFILSKTLNYLTLILLWIGVLLLLSAFLKNQKWRKRCFITALIMFFFFSNDFIANELMRAWELPATPIASINRKYKMGIVLTGVTIGKREPDDRVYFNKGADRVTHAVQLYKLGIIEHVMISGGNGRLTGVEEPEADELKKAFLIMGVPDSAISLENQSRNTYESAEALKVMFADSVRKEDCLLITSAFHMRRSRACFNKAGLPMDTYSVDFYSHRRSFYPDSLLVPSVEAIVLWQKLIKEWVGMLAYKMAGHI